MSDTIDLNKLSKAELKALVEAMQVEQAAAPTPPPAAPQTAVIDVNALVGALAAAREAPRGPVVDDTLHKVVNAKGVALGFEVTDTRTGLKRQISLQGRGESVMLTAAQIDEVRSTAPHFFGHGYLAADGVVPENPNTVRDIPAFLDALTFETMEPRIAAIDALPPLWDLYNHIETLRFRHADEKGQPLVRQIDGGNMLVLEEIPLSPMLTAVEVAVKRRIEALSNVRISLDAK